MSFLSHLWSAALLVLSTAVASANPQMRLLDDLDYPSEGYCIDVVGVGASARTDLPLVVHNCLPDVVTEDRMAVYQNSRIEMPAYDACVTAFGVRTPMPGAPVVLRPCGGRESFFPRGELQRFDRTTTGQLQLRGTSLCLAAGAESAPTFGRGDRWRSLAMEPCETVPLERSVWQ